MEVRKEEGEKQKCKQGMFAQGEGGRSQSMVVRKRMRKEFLAPVLNKQALSYFLTALTHREDFFIPLLDGRLFLSVIFHHGSKR